MITLENINNQRQKTYHDSRLISDYMLSKKVIAFSHSFNLLEVTIYYE